MIVLLLLNSAWMQKEIKLHLPDYWEISLSETCSHINPKIFPTCEHCRTTQLSVPYTNLHSSTGLDWVDVEADNSYRRPASYQSLRYSSCGLLNKELPRECVRLSSYNNKRRKDKRNYHLKDVLVLTKSQIFFHHFALSRLGEQLTLLATSNSFQLKNCELICAARIHTGWSLKGQSHQFETSKDEQANLKEGNRWCFLCRLFFYCSVVFQFR